MEHRLPKPGELWYCAQFHFIGDHWNAYCREWKDRMKHLYQNEYWWRDPNKCHPCQESLVVINNEDLSEDEGEPEVPDDPQYQVGQLVERKDKDRDWGTGYVTSLDPLEVTVEDDPKEDGWPWEEVRPLPYAVALANKSASRTVSPEAENATSL